MPDDPREPLILAAALLVLSVLVVNQFATLLDRPEVWVSYTTGKCVKVVDRKAMHEGSKSRWSCDRLPESYEHVLVD